ncbi:nitroreductase [Streptosporangium becharense]|uniref:Nitroreductase n=1 Tax=Streptosporangium becharense TaxID=1816182 RepID=A0A7W9IK80_9ACTN|nr:nitroreductase family protein [Streptosporangium becharense]MBB2913168.1 nitroreductase [Streptosporangium becharense]MBB5822151.1 nitroreductase [Streptosporangium becharense]
MSDEAMDVFEALYTTRAMRRVKPDPIPEQVQRSILDAAVRAPSAGNTQGWRFMLVDDPGVKASLGPLYRDALDKLFEGHYRPMRERAEAEGDTGTLNVLRSARHLADHFEDYPLLLFAFTRNDPSGGSIFPAVWSAQLAARAHGVGSALTSVLGVFHAEETMRVLGVPEGRGWSVACTVTFGYPTGRWGVAPRRPVHEVSYRNRWGEPVGFEIHEPLWGYGNRPPAAGDAETRTAITSAPDVISH